MSTAVRLMACVMGDEIVNIFEELFDIVVDGRDDFRYFSILNVKAAF
jgi:hypothetical protein